MDLPERTLLRNPEESRFEPSTVQVLEIVNRLTSLSVLLSDDPGWVNSFPLGNNECSPEAGSLGGWITKITRIGVEAWLAKANRLVYVMHRENRIEVCEEWLFSDCGDESCTLALPKLQKPKISVPGVPLQVIERERAIEFVVAETKGTFYFNAFPWSWREDQKGTGAADGASPLFG